MSMSDGDGQLKEDVPRALSTISKILKSILFSKQRFSILPAQQFRRASWKRSWVTHDF